MRTVKGNTGGESIEASACATKSAAAAAAATRGRSNEIIVGWTRSQTNKMRLAIPCARGGGDAVESKEAKNPDWPWTRPMTKIRGALALTRDCGGFAGANPPENLGARAIVPITARHAAQYRYIKMNLFQFGLVNTSPEIIMAEDHFYQTSSYQPFHRRPTFRTTTLTTDRLLIGCEE